MPLPTIDDVIKNSEELPLEVLEELNIISKLLKESKQKANDAALEKNIKDFIKEWEIKRKSLPFSADQEVYRAIYIVAALVPINSECPLSKEEPPKKYHIVLPSRHMFDIRFLCLAMLHKSRNPINRKDFSEEEVAVIKGFAQRFPFNELLIEPFPDQYMTPLLRPLLDIAEIETKRSSRHSRSYSSYFFGLNSGINNSVTSPVWTIFTDEPDGPTIRILTVGDFSEFMRNSRSNHNSRLNISSSSASSVTNATENFPTSFFRPISEIKQSPVFVEAKRAGSHLLTRINSIPVKRIIRGAWNIFPSFVDEFQLRMLSYVALTVLSTVLTSKVFGNNEKFDPSIFITIVCSFEYQILIHNKNKKTLYELDKQQMFGEVESMVFKIKKILFQMTWVYNIPRLVTIKKMSAIDTAAVTLIFEFQNATDPAVRQNLRSRAVILAILSGNITIEQAKDLSSTELSMHENILNSQTTSELTEDRSASLSLSDPD